MMLKAHKIRLEPNNIQRTKLNQSAGVSRFAYNWALNQWQTQYNKGEKPNQFQLRKQLNSVKKEQFPWMAEITKCAPQEAIIDLGKAYKNFFNKRAQHPKFKKKGIKDSFKVSSGAFKVEGNRIRLPKIGWIRMSETLKHEGTPISVTVSQKAGIWFAAITTETVTTHPDVPNKTIGVDWGVNEIVTSDNERFRVPRSYRRAEAKLRRAQKELNRRQKGSNNRAKTRNKIAKIHYKTSNQRNDFTHKLTTHLANTNNIIVIENLKPSNMVKNRKLAKSILDANYFEIKRQLTYKTQERKTTLIIADQWFPSTQLCSTCQVKTKLNMNIRKWVCQYCATPHDRDHNAAMNLKQYAVSSTVSACGEIPTTVLKKFSQQVSSMKQELNTQPILV